MKTAVYEPFNIAWALQSSLVFIVVVFLAANIICPNHAKGQDQQLTLQELSLLVEQLTSHELRLFVEFALLSEKGKTAEAERIYEKLRELRPELPRNFDLSKLVVPLRRTENAEQTLAQDQTLTQQQRQALNVEAEQLITKFMEIYGQGNYAEAVPIAQRILGIVNALEGSQNGGYTSWLNNLAQLYTDMGDYSKAEPLFLQSLEIRRKVLGEEDPATAISLNNLASLYFNMGEYAKAEPLFLQSLEIRRKVLGEEDPDTAVSLNNLANLYSDMGDYAKAEPLHLKSLEIMRKVLGEKHPDTAVSLNNLANLYSDMGDFAKAEPLHLQSLEIMRKVKGVEHPDTATSLNSLASLYYNMGDYVKAEPLFLQSLEIRRKVLGEEHPHTASSLNNLAHQYTDMGDFAKAEPLYKQSLEIRRKVLGEEHPDTAVSLSNLAKLYLHMGKFSQAEPIILKSLEIRRKVLGEEHPDTAVSLNNLANLYGFMGDHAKAEPLFLQSLEIQRKVLGVEHPTMAICLQNLAGLYRSMGDYAKAEQLYRQSLKIRRKVLGEEHPDTALCLYKLAHLYDDMGHSQQAFEMFDQEQRSVHAHVTKQLPVLSWPQQKQYLRTNYNLSFHGALSLGFRHLEDPSIVGLAGAWLINGKAVGQEALAQRNLLTRDVDDPERGEMARQLVQTRRQLAQLAMSTPEPDQIEARKARLDELQSEEQRLSRELSAAGGGFDTVATEWIELEQVRDAIPQNAVLVDIARFDVFDFKAKGDEPKWQPARYSAWITHPTGGPDPVIVDLGPAEEIDELIAKVRSQIEGAGGSEGSIASDGEEEAAKQLNKDLQLLADKIWNPIQEHVDDAEKIVLSPDGELWLAPWSALPIGTADEEKYLIEDFELQLVISARDLVVESKFQPQQRPMMFADPLFDQKAAQKLSAIHAIFKTLPEADNATTRSFSAKNLLPEVSPLPNTAIEAMAVQPNLEKYTGQKPVLYKEQYALERVAKAIKRPKVVSFATHGFFLPTQEVELEDDRMLSMDNDTRSIPLTKDGKPVENPLLRCGLLLAGCNNRDAVVGDDDGILTGLEIVSMDLRGTELVVLSACETGIGEVNNGEGVAGLRQAFQLAGAESVVATLWQVPDRDSALIMNDFFDELADGQTKSAALRLALIQRIQSRRQRYGAAHPFYWAAWTVTGK